MNSCVLFQFIIPSCHTSVYCHTNSLSIACLAGLYANSSRIGPILSGERPYCTDHHLLPAAGGQGDQYFASTTASAAAATGELGSSVPATFPGLLSATIYLHRSCHYAAYLQHPGKLSAKLY
ncbi:unnamed protein product [Protopolystoma xenopodis]|uniref:Uncharacterized protein n=1 Tax=Protopolystoma xenopodis TaxID=117903 RepID=A0A3S5CR32_9PLAT|nr:unnamed protein product [Protopolystoma xenopodis]